MLYNQYEEYDNVVYVLWLYLLRFPIFGIKDLTSGKTFMTSPFTLGRFQGRKNKVNNDNSEIKND